MTWLFTGAPLVTPVLTSIFCSRLRPHQSPLSTPVDRPSRHEPCHGRSSCCSPARAGAGLAADLPPVTRAHALHRNEPAMRREPPPRVADPCDAPRRRARRVAVAALRRARTGMSVEDDAVAGPDRCRRGRGGCGNRLLALGAYAAPPGSVRGLHLVVAEIEAAHASWVSRGVDVGAVE